MQGHIHKRVHSTADGRTTSTWYVVVDVGRKPDGKRRQKWHGGFRTRKEAEAARAAIVNDLNRGTYVEPSPITLAEWVNDPWLVVAKSRLKASTWDSYKRTLDLHLLPAFGAVRLTDIAASSLDRHYAELLENGRKSKSGGPLSARSVRYVHAVIRKVLADAVDAGLLVTNPAARAKPPRVPRSSAPTMTYWEPHELSAFLGVVAGTDLEIAWHLLAMTGMRRGEVLGVRWGDIDRDLARLAVRHTFISVGYAIQEEVPKSHQARVIDLDTGTVAKLEVHRLRQAADKAELCARYSTRDLVVACPDGAPIHPDRLTKIFQRTIEDAGLRRIRLHDLRHTHATLALRAGVPVKVISERLGHESPGFTLSQYAHVMPGMQAEAAELVRAIVAGAGRDAES